ncbi:MAG: TIR domain-containing protein, partial [Gammaproteobacteria bacterium]
MPKPLPAYQGDEPFLFVSYAHANAEAVHVEMIWLQERGFNLWYDDAIEIGSDWRQSLANAITRAEGFVFFADEQSVVSPNCVREINFALDEDKPIYVVQLDDVTFPDALRLSLSDRQILIRSNFDEPTFRDRLAAALHREADLEELPAHARRKRAKVWPWWLTGVAIVVGGVLAFAWLTTKPVPSFSNPAQVTSATGVEEYPAWSPSGQMIAYQSNEDGDWDIWVRQPGSSEAINRTTSNDGHDMFPSWSPDGRSIAFWSDRDGSGYYLMPALTGDSKKLVSLTVDALGSLRYKPIGPPRWSRDGKRLMYVVGTITSGAYGEVLSLETGETQRFEMPGRVPGFDPAWSPNEELVTWVAGWHREYETSAISVLRLADGATGLITDDRLQHLNPTWVDDERIVYVVNRGSSRDLWLQSLTADLLPRGPPLRLTTGVGMRQASFSPDRSKLAYSKGRRISNVWRVPILADRPATWSDAQQVTFDQAWVEFIDISLDGTQLVVS